MLILGTIDLPERFAHTSGPNKNINHCDEDGNYHVEYPTDHHTHTHYSQTANSTVAHLQHNQDETNRPETFPGNPAQPNSQFPHSYPSPHRVVVPSKSRESPIKQLPISKRELQLYLEKADLSSHIEIIRIKNELARLKCSLNVRESSPK